MPICSHSSVDTHTDCREYGVGITQLGVNYSLHTLSGGSRECTTALYLLG